MQYAGSFLGVDEAVNMTSSGEISLMRLASRSDGIREDTPKSVHDSAEMEPFPAARALSEVVTGARSDAGTPRSSAVVTGAR